MPSKLDNPPVFPMKFKVFLRWMTPDLRHHAERLRLIRQYLYEALKANPLPSEVAEKSADELISFMSRHGLKNQNNPVDFFTMMKAVKAWRKSQMIQQRKNARASRTLKNYQKKILQLIQNRITASRKPKNGVS
jgi:hypothetical protein